MKKKKNNLIKLLAHVIDQNEKDENCSRNKRQGKASKKERKMLNISS